MSNEQHAAGSMVGKGLLQACRQRASETTVTNLENYASFPEEETL